MGTLNSWYPNELRIICPALVRSEIPVIGIAETPHVPIQKEKLGPSRMKIGVDVILLGDSGSFAIVEQPDRLCGTPNGSQSDGRIQFPRFIDVFVQAVMKQVVAVAPLRIGRANPNRGSQGRSRISAPGHLAVRTH